METPLSPSTWMNFLISWNTESRPVGVGSLLFKDLIPGDQGLRKFVEFSTRLESCEPSKVVPKGEKP
eukprot:11612879-Ditylum_brightwellii.AAC.1